MYIIYLRKKERERKKGRKQSSLKEVRQTPWIQGYIVIEADFPSSVRELRLFSAAQLYTVLIMIMSRRGNTRGVSSSELVCLKVLTGV